MNNTEPTTVDGFGAQWSRFDHTAFSEAELLPRFHAYFRIFPFDTLPKDAHGFDAGCGTGRWARCMAPRVGRLVCVDAAAGAVEAARRNLSMLPNVEFHVASINDMPVPDESMDFGYCLGVLHYVPDPLAGLRALTRKLKKGAPLLIYVYYALDNRPGWYRGLWRVVDKVRSQVSRLPYPAKYAVSQAIAGGVYLPLARGARRLEKLGVSVENIPLSSYRNKPFYVMRTDALDRFAPLIEHRFTREEVVRLMEEAGLGDVRVSDGVPFWVAVGTKR